MHNGPQYSPFVEAFARTGPQRTGPSKSGDQTELLSQVTGVVKPELLQVDARIVKQAAAFDPAIEGYVSYAIGGHGKRLRPGAHARLTPHAAALLFPNPQSRFIAAVSPRQQCPQAQQPDIV